MPLIDTRKTPSLPVNAKTVFVCLFPFYTGEYPTRNVARFAMLNDYHKVCGDMLASFAAQLKAAFPTDEFVPFIDSSPIREVHAAHCAGLGAIGRHGMLIHEIYGSRVFIGTITSSLALKPQKPDTFRTLLGEANDSNARNRFDAKGCLDCRKCIKACPTGALSLDKPLDRTLCRAAITQKKGALTDWEQAQIKAGGLAWGCDICADVCPRNQHAAQTPIKAFVDDIAPLLTRENLSGLIAKKPYGWRGKAVLLRNLSLLEEA